MSEKKIIDLKIKKEYEKDESFRTYYITGALGGFLNPYDFRLAFYNVDTTKFILDTQAIKANESLAEEEIVEKVQEKKMFHNVMCEVIMSERALKELHQFLGKELKSLEKMRNQTKD